MFNLIKAIFKYHRGAISAIALLHVFTFIPASMVFWFEEQKNMHLVYYALIAAVAVLTSWIFSWVTKDIKPTTKHFLLKIEIAFAILALLAAPFLLTFYFGTAIFFLNFFEQNYSILYTGPNRAISAAIVFVFYNLFFAKDIIKSFRNSGKNQI
jgi:small-conductance mechanosensitive channel